MGESRWEVGVSLEKLFLVTNSPVFLCRPHLDSKIGKSYSGLCTEVKCGWRVESHRGCHGKAFSRRKDGFMQVFD